MSVELAALECEVCERATEHELHYAGRLLESVRCTVCGTHIELSARALLPSYVVDLERRVASKPRRMLRRARLDPVGFARALPASLMRQPAKFVREFWAILRR